MKIYAIRLLVGNSEEPLPEGPYILASSNKILASGDYYFTYNNTPQILENTLNNQ